MDREQRNDRFTEIEERFAGYEVYDRDYEKVGKVDDLFVDENDQPEYIGVKMGLFGLSGSTLIPWDVVRVNEERQLVQVDAEKDKIKNAPSFDDDTEITPEFENRIREHYGLGALAGATDRGAYGAYHAETTDQDELRVPRTEEELRAGTREHEAGAVRVRKRVYTEPEQVRVPKRREEVHVDRVPAEGEASEAEIGEDEVRVPVTEEEVVAEKRPVAKEEVRIRKESVEDEETAEAEVRKEEVEVDDETRRSDR